MRRLIREFMGLEDEWAGKSPATSHLSPGEVLVADDLATAFRGRPISNPERLSRLSLLAIEATKSAAFEVTPGSIACQTVLLQQDMAKLGFEINLQPIS